MKVLDLFSGIGGFSLGLERTGGYKTVAFCEIEPFPRKVLAKHWRKVPIYEDVRTLTAERLAADGIAVDVICGGFPCQDISTAGKGAGLAGERSGLWSEIARLVGELAPRFVIVENVAALLARGLGDVLGDLAALRYDAEWYCIPASAVGAPHRRDRIWIVAYPAGDGWEQGDANGCRGSQGIGAGEEFRFRHGCEALAQSASNRLPRSRQPILWRGAAQTREGQATWPSPSGVGNVWRVEPNVGRVANGVPDRAHRLKALGNAVVPQIPELIGRAILQSLDRAA